jgi:hypothetical protein
MEQLRGGRKRRHDGDAIEPHRRPWMLAFTKDVLEEIRAAHVLPCDILQSVADYAFNNPTIHLQVQKDLDKWPFKTASAQEREPLQDINLKLCDTLLDVMTAFERIGERDWLIARVPESHVLRKLVLTSDSEWSHIELDMVLPKLHLQIGEALHSIGVTSKQLQERFHVVRLKLKYIRITVIE